MVTAVVCTCIRPTGRSRIFIGTLKPKSEFRINKTGPGKRIEMGLGPAVDMPLAKVRQRTAEIREMLLEGIDPRVERLKSKEEAKPVADKPVVTFGGFALELLDSIEGGFKSLSIEPNGAARCSDHPGRFPKSG